MSSSPTATIVPPAGADSSTPQDDQRKLVTDAIDAPDSDTQKQLLPGLTKELESELLGVVNELERESYPTWRLIFRELLEAESFWKDIQQGYYDYETDTLRVPNISDSAPAAESGQRFQYITNIYRALGWTVISILGQKLPTTIFMPVDFTNENDVAASRAASDVAPLIARNNCITLLNMKAIYYLFTGGIFAGYVRYIVDGESFGYKEEDGVSMASYGKCQECGEYFPVNDLSQPQQCSSCQAEVPPENLQTIQLPQIVTTKRTPKGQEVISLHGGLELRLPPWVQDRRDWPYIGLVNEIHKSVVRATYGDRAKDIEGGFSTEGPYDNWDRFARMALLEPTVGYYSLSNTNLVTVKRYWLRRKTLYTMKDQTKRDALLKLFPNGVYVAMTDNVLLDARDELLDAHWRVCRGMEGHGMFTPPLGHSAISLQKRLNTLMNFIMEWVEYSAAGMGTFVNTGVINVKALTQARRAPGMIWGLRLGANANLSQNIHTDQAPPLAGEIFKHADDLLEYSQQVTGAVPTVSGGTQQSLKPTTYLADREQALGKMFVPWQHLRQFWAEVNFLAVKLFAENRTEDEKYSIPSPTGVETVNRIVRLETLTGEFDAYPEVNENFPRLWSDEQAMFMQLLQSQDPQIQEILGSVRNLPYAKAMFGMPNLFVPGEDDHKKQQLEIAQLLMQQPMSFPDPATGQMIVQPSIPPDVFEDNHLEHENTVKEWAVSSAGIRAKTEQPMGYQNVIAHGKAHHDILIQQAAQQAQQMAAAQGPPPGAPPSGGGGKGKGKGKEPMKGATPPSPTAQGEGAEERVQQTVDASGGGP